MVRYLFRYILTLYIFLFISYNLLPVKYFDTEVAIVSTPAPTPFVYPYKYIFGLKTVFNANLGNPLKLLRIANEKNIDFVITETPFSPWLNFGGTYLVDKAEKNCLIINDEHIRPIQKALYYFFEYIPKTLTRNDREDLFSLYFPKDKNRCIVLASDSEIIFSIRLFGGIDFPSYSHIIGKRGNILFTRDIYGDLSDIGDDIIKTVATTDRDMYFMVYGYSERSFYMPGEIAKYPFRLVIKVDKPKAIVLIHKDGKNVHVFDTEGRKTINIPIVRKGSYSVTVLSYKLKIWKLYFGIRWLSYAPSIVYKAIS